MNKNIFKLFIRICIIVAAAFGIYLQVFIGGLHKLNFYTVWSNIVVMVFYIYYLSKKEDSEGLLRVKGGVVLGITLTFIVYNILLLPTVKPEDFYNWKNYTLHYIVPILCIIDCLIYDKVRYNWKDPLYWTIFPLFYAVFALVKGIAYPVNIPGEDSPFPYFFVDVNKLGAFGVAKYIIIICVFYIVIGYILLFIKKINIKK